MTALTRGQKFLVGFYGVMFVGMVFLNIFAMGQRDRANTERDAAIAGKAAVIEACRLKVEPPPAS